MRDRVLVDELGKPLWVMGMGLVTRPGENHQSAAWQQPVAMLTMLYRDHRIVVAPDDQHFTAIKEVQFIQGRHPLALDVNETALG